MITGLLIGFVAGVIGRGILAKLWLRQSIKRKYFELNDRRYAIKLTR